MPVEAKAKRTHARRSCEVCKVRKTRCELPDVNVPPSANALPGPKSCHRCRILHIPCIVNDVEKFKKTSAIAAATPTSGAESPPGQTKKRRRAESDRAGTPTGSLETDLHRSLYDVHAFQVETVQGSWPDIHATARRRSLGTRTARNGEQRVEGMLNQHNRPYPVACRFFEVAYKGRADMRRFATGKRPDEVDLRKLLNEKMLARLASGQEKVRMYHPHFTHMADLIKLLDLDPSPGRYLFLWVVAYLSSLALPPDEDVCQLRATLAPLIQTVRASVILNLPPDLEACQALQMLSVHAPFGVLPLEQTDLSDVHVAKGQLSAALAIYHTLGLQSQVLKKLDEGNVEGLASMYENWLWLNLVAESAAAELQEDRPAIPSLLKDGVRFANTLMSQNLNFIRVHCMGFHKIQTLGRIFLCDRILRLADTLETMTKMRDIFESTATDPYYPAMDALRVELDSYNDRVTAREKGVEEMLGGLKSETSFDGIDDGIVLHRRLSILYERNRVIGAGLRFVYAIGSMPEHPNAIPGLPTKLSASEKIRYALSESSKPANLLAYLDRGPSDPGNQILWHLGPRRGDFLEGVNILIHRDIGPRLVAATDDSMESIIIPIHFVLANALDACKVHLEMQAASILVARHGTSDVASRSPDRANLMKRVHERIVRFNAHSVEDGCGGASIEQGFADTISAVYKTSQTYIRLALQANMPSVSTVASEDSVNLATPRSDDSKDVDKAAVWRDARTSSKDPTPPYTVSGSAPCLAGPPYGAPQQHALDSSGRWQAKTGPHDAIGSVSHFRAPASQSRTDAPAVASQPTPAAVAHGMTDIDLGLTPLDHVLAQMFNYKAEDAPPTQFPQLPGQDQRRATDITVHPALSQKLEAPGKWAEEFK